MPAAGALPRARRASSCDRDGETSSLGSGGADATLFLPETASWGAGAGVSLWTKAVETQLERLGVHVREATAEEIAAMG